MVRTHMTMQLNMNSEEVELLLPYYGEKEKASGLSEEAYYGRRFKCLWLLHGLGGVSDDWLRMTMVETYAEEKGIIVICPEGRSNYYTDCRKGDAFETRITQDVWDYLHRMVPVMSAAPEDNIVMGNSMGGYGAARFAIRHPDRFGYGVALSGGLNVPQRYVEGETINGHLDQAFGDRDGVIGSQYDLYAEAERMSAQGLRPRLLYIACGTLDWEYEPNRAFCERLNQLGYQTAWDEGNYGHEWRFWDRQCEKALNFILPDDFTSSRPQRGEVEESA